MSYLSLQQLVFHVQTDEAQEFNLLIYPELTCKNIFNKMILNSSWTVLLATQKNCCLYPVLDTVSLKSIDNWGNIQ